VKTKANLYFELPELTYYVQRNITVRNGVEIDMPDIGMVNRSYRVWIETSTKIKYLKNRFGGTNSAVDKEEFVWIKLKSKEFNRG